MGPRETVMFCPFCGVHDRSLVTDSSWEDNHKTIQRKRLCLDCGYKWSTLEIDSDQVASLEDIIKGTKRDGKK